MTYQVRTIKSWPEVEQLKNDWQRLAKLSIYNTIFQSFAWHQAWWQAFRNLCQPVVIVIKHNKQVIAIAPLMLNSLGELEILGSLETEYQNFLVHPEHPAAWALIFDNIFAKRRYKTIKLWELPQLGELNLQLNNYLNNSHNYTAELTFSFQAWNSEKINKRDIKYRRNKLKRIGQVVCCTPADDPAKQLGLLELYFNWLEDRFHNSLSRYRQRQLSVEYKNFCRNLIQLFPSGNSQPYLHMVELSLDDRIIAIDKTIRTPDTIYGLMQTYDPIYAEYSPGSILLQESLNTWLDEGITSSDFLRGDEDYKMRFVNTTLPLVRYTFYPTRLSKFRAVSQARAKQLLKPVIFTLHDNYLKLKATSYKLQAKKLIFWLSWYSGAASLYQFLTRNRSRVLCYHSISDHPLANKTLTVSPKSFADQIRQAKLLQASGCKLEVTFDDGYQDNFTQAWPILKKYNLPAKIFPTIKFINQGFVPGWQAEPNFPALTWEQIVKMRKSGLIEFGSHTISHTDLGQLNKDEIEKELKESKQILESEIMNHELSNILTIENCKLKISNLAYPFGKKANYNQDVISIAKNLGFKKCYTIEEGTNSSKTDPFKLQRLVIFDEPMYMFKVRVSGIIDDMKNFIKISLP